MKKTVGLFLIVLMVFGGMTLSFAAGSPEISYEIKLSSGGQEVTDLSTLKAGDTVDLSVELTRTDRSEGYILESMEMTFLNYGLQLSGVEFVSDPTPEQNEAIINNIKKVVVCDIPNGEVGAKKNALDSGFTVSATYRDASDWDFEAKNNQVVCHWTYIVTDPANASITRQVAYIRASEVNASVTPGGGDAPVAPTPTPTPDPEPTVIDEPEVPLAVPEGLNGKDHIAYVQGYEDGTVRPEGNITRAETATIIYRLLTAERRDAICTAKNDFSDVDAAMWFNKAVSSMSAGEYINGYPDGTFKGDNNITRSEFVAIMARFLGGEGKAEFKDVPEGYWAKNDVAIAADAGWLAGYEDGTFRPDQPITRAEAMTIMNRVLKRGVDESSEIRDFKAFPDNADRSAWYYYEVIEATNSHGYEGLRPSEQWTSNEAAYPYDADRYERP